MSTKRSIIRSCKSHHGGSAGTETGISNEVPVQNPDFKIENHGSIFLLRPLSAAAHCWVKEFIGESNGFQPYWPTVVIEHGFVPDVVAGIREYGLEVRG